MPNQRLILPGELAKHAVAEVRSAEPAARCTALLDSLLQGTKAVTKFWQSGAAYGGK